MFPRLFQYFFPPAPNISGVPERPGTPQALTRTQQKRANRKERRAAAAADTVSITPSGEAAERKSTAVAMASSLEKVGKLRPAAPNMQTGLLSPPPSPFGFDPSAANEGDFQPARRRSSGWSQTSRSSRSSRASSFAQRPRYAALGPSLTPTAMWDEKNAAHHYRLHGEGVASNQSAYERLAVQLHQSPVSLSRPAFVDRKDAGTVYRYDTENSLFSAAADDGTIKTLFKLESRSISYSYSEDDKERTVTVRPERGLQFKYLAAVNHFNDTDSPLSMLSGAARKRILGRARVLTGSDEDIIV